MGIIESMAAAARGASSERPAATPTGSMPGQQQRPEPAADHLQYRLFYDVYKNSVGILTGHEAARRLATHRRSSSPRREPPDPPEVRPSIAEVDRSESPTAKEGSSEHGLARAEPVEGSNQPVSGNNEPEVSWNEPEVDYNEQTVDYHEPKVDYNELDTDYNDPEANVCGMKEWWNEPDVVKIKPKVDKIDEEVEKSELESGNGDSEVDQSESKKIRKVISNHDVLGYKSEVVPREPEVDESAVERCSPEIVEGETGTSSWAWSESPTLVLSDLPLLSGGSLFRHGTPRDPTETQRHRQDSWPGHLRTNDENCNYTCHDHCSTLVTLNCKERGAEIVNEMFEVKREEPQSLMLYDPPSDLELSERIARYNLTAQGYEMTVEEGSGGTTFHGWVRVHLNLSRPINVLAGTRPPSIYDILQESDCGTVDEEAAERTLTSFYLPRDTVKALHVSSDTTARQMIAALLRKFKVVDHPQKFCLYEKHWLGEGSSGKGILRIVQDHEKPLWLVLSWEAETVQNRKLVLQENDTGGIMWEAFTVPELSNFLRILDREEDEYLNQVRARYARMAEQLQEAMDRFAPDDRSNLQEGGGGKGPTDVRRDDQNVRRYQHHHPSTTGTI